MLRYLRLGMTQRKGHTAPACHVSCASESSKQRGRGGDASPHPSRSFIAAFSTLTCLAYSQPSHTSGL